MFGYGHVNPDLPYVVHDENPLERSGRCHEESSPDVTGNPEEKPPGGLLLFCSSVKLKEIGGY